MPPANLGSWFGSTISTAVKPLYDCFIEHATYVFTTGRNIRDLHTNTGTFVGQRDDIQQQLETGRRNGLVERNEARTWLERANKAINDEQGNRERYEQRCKIFGCWAPNCWSNYKISKKAAKTLIEVNWCSENRPETITEEPPPQPVEIVQVMSVSLKPSQVSILNLALGYIKDDATVGLVGIWGPRQVGKTLLLKMINNSFRAHCSPSASTDTRDTTNASTSETVPENPTNTRDPTNASTSFFSQIHKRFACHCIKKKSLTNNPSTSEIVDPTNTGTSHRGQSHFHFIIYVTASINCTVKTIQSQIMGRLKIHEEDSDSENTRATRIYNFLKDKSFLVLLDDLRNDLDLTAVGLPHPLGVHGQLKWKVVITTRAQSVCYKMKANRDINVPGLQMEEALELFVGSAGGENVYSNPNMTAHVQGLVDILRVLPTELISFGRDMRGKGEPKQWDDVTHVVKELIKIQDSEEKSLRERIVIKLKEDVKKLREESSSVRGKIELAKGNGMVATDKAKSWLARADSIISDSTAICESERTEANWDICIAAARLREVGVCINDRPSVSDIAQPPSVMHIPVHVSLPLQPSQRFLAEQVRQYIIDDTGGMIGIWGPVGVGKTLLLSTINNSFETENSLTPGSLNTGEPPFDFVIYLKATEECSLGNIQSEIMQRLKMQDSGSVTTRATRIHEFLQDKSFLVLVDGLQDDVDLSVVGLPDPLGVYGQLNRKVVITTRSQTLCRKMKVNKDMYVSGLQKDEALELFKGGAGRENVYSDPNIREHMENLVDILRTVPAELINFGRDMRGKVDPMQWQDVIHVVKELIKIQGQEATSMREGIVKRLNEHVEKVRAKSSYVRDKIDELAKGNGMVATDKAKTWLSRADTIISDGTDICDSERTKVNWDISIAAAKLRELRECLNDRPSDIVQPPSVMHIPVHDALQQSQVCFVKLARQHIIDNPEGITAICGPVGVGKTLLLEMINNSFETENPLTPSSSNTGGPPFDFVIYLKATEECSVGNIQSEIMQRLKMQDSDSVTTPATRIYEFLQDKSFLVLLDGLQTYLDLAVVGLPPLGILGKLKKKVVVTTRSQRLCAEMRASKVMNVSGLDRDEALQLFQQTVGCENLYSNPRIGKHAEDIVDVLRARPAELINLGMELRTIGDPKQWEHVILNKKEYWQQPSRAEVFKQAMEYIKDMEYVKHKPVDVIGIWGLGGVGKTHLLEKIQNQVNSLFDDVIFVTASKVCSVQNIQDQIVKNHNLEKADGEKNQAKIISRFLKGKSFVLLLDDLWDHIDLEAVGIPVRHSSERQQKRKVVITTRERKVCGLMEVRKEISVECLLDDEAWQIFQDKVGQETLSSSPRIETLAKELVKEMKGLPLALITTGRAMWGKSHPKDWEYAIDYMKNSCCDKNDPLTMETVFRRLKYSYDSLKNDILRNCFLTCSLWPEDWVIHMEELYECWTGLGIVDKSDIHECYKEVHHIVGELKSACLLEICEYPPWSYLVQRQTKSQRTKASIKMHDVVRDMAIWISNDCGKSDDNWVVRAGIRANSSRNTIPWSKVECVSLMYNEMKESPFGSDHCCMKLKTLYLKGNSLSEFIAGSGTSQSFSALTFLDLSWNNLTGISESLCGLANLEYLNVSNNESIDKVPVSLRQLKKLKFLYLGGTTIRRIPKGIIKSLKELKVVDLITDSTATDHEFGTDWIIRELCTLANLKAVNIAIGSETLLQEARNFPIRDLVISNLREASELCLTDGIFSSEIERRALYELYIQDCSVEKIIADDMSGPFEALKVLSLFKLQDLEEIMWIGTITPQGLFPSLTHVVIYRCKVQHLSWVMYLPCLEDLDVRRCHNMKQAFRSTENYGEEMCWLGQSSRASVNTFPCLTRLHFESHPELTSLCDSDVTFPSLRSLEITKCPKLKLPFTRQSLPKKLGQLKMDKHLLHEMRLCGAQFARKSSMMFR